MLKHLIQFLLCLSSLAFFHQSVSAQNKKIDLQGHRGCRGLLPENTIAAILHSIDLGVTTLEMDVVITKDNKVILSHEPFMNPEIATPPTGQQFSSPKDKSFNVYAMTYEEVTKWDVGMKFYPNFPLQKKMPAIKPLLSDVIAAVEEYTKAKKLKPLNYNIETKCAPSTDGISHPNPEAFVSLLMDVVTKEKISKRTIIQSFDKRTLQVLHQSFPSMKTSYLFGGSNKKTPEQLVDDLGFRPDMFSPVYTLIDKGFIEACRKLNIKVIAWTVNEEKDIEKMAALGVDGIISDYPDRFSILKNR
jgi:glycerophosphoryl diester phosphodiesterase